MKKLSIAEKKQPLKSVMKRFFSDNNKESVQEKEEEEDRECP